MPEKVEKNNDDVNPSFKIMGIPVGANVRLWTVGYAIYDPESLYGNGLECRLTWIYPEWIKVTTGETPARNRRVFHIPRSAIVAIEYL
jgi:hypothetical protein